MSPLANKPAKIYNSSHALWCLLGHLNHNQTEMQRFFRAETVGFCSSHPFELALKETDFFRRKPKNGSAGLWRRAEQKPQVDYF